MSRVAKSPVSIPAGVEVEINDKNISVKGSRSKLTRIIHLAVNVQYYDGKLTFTPHEGYVNGWALAGTTRSIVNNMVIGVTDGFTKKLHLIGIGYRAAITGNILNLSLGFSHTINHELPSGITAECPSQIEIVLKGADKQVVGQVAADIRAYRRPEPYKGKGIRYADEIIRIKETKKK